MITDNIVSPESIGYDSQQLTVLDDFFRHQMDRGVLRCVNYAIARDGKTFAVNSIGKLSYNESDARPLTSDSIYPICSETKLITVCAIFKLVEMGLIRLSQPIHEFIPEFNKSSAKAPFSSITIAHLLTHTSGFGVDPGAITYKRPHHYELIQKAFDSGDTNWIKASMGAGFTFMPGEQWGYASFGYTLLAEIVKRVSGMKESEFVQKYIFDPCGMTDTSYGPVKDKADRIIVNNPKMEKLIEALKSGDEGDSPWQMLPMGGTGVFSTTEDLLRFGNMLMNKGTYNGKRVLGRKSVEKMSTVYTAPNVLDKCWGDSKGTYRRYGLGPDMRCNDDCLYSPETFFHEGAGRCSLIIDPTERMVAVYLIPYVDNDRWDPEPIWNAHSVIWAGLM